MKSSKTHNTPEFLTYLDNVLSCIGKGEISIEEIYFKIEQETFEFGISKYRVAGKEIYDSSDNLISIEFGEELLYKKQDKLIASLNFFIHEGLIKNIGDNISPLFQITSKGLIKLHTSNFTKDYKTYSIREEESQANLTYLKSQNKMLIVVLFLSFSSVVIELSKLIAELLSK